MKQNAKKLTRKERIMSIIAPKRFDRYWIEKLNAESREEERQTERKRKIQLLEESNPEDVDIELHETTLVIVNGYECTFREWVVTVQGQAITSLAVRESKPSKQYLYDLIMTGLKTGTI